MKLKEIVALLDEDQNIMLEDSYDGDYLEITDKANLSDEFMDNEVVAMKSHMFEDFDVSINYVVIKIKL